MSPTPILPSRPSRSTDGSTESAAPDGLRVPATSESSHRATPLRDSNLWRGLFASAIFHAFGVAFALGLFKPDLPAEVVAIDRTVDIEVAPAPPKAEAPIAEVAAERVAKPSASPRLTARPDDQGTAARVGDAGVDAAVDAAPRRPRRARPIADAGGIAAPPDGRPEDGVAPSDAGDSSDADRFPVEPTTPSDAGSSLAFIGTAANLLAYFPPGQVVTALVRFDRLRGTEWAAVAEALLRPMPDYRALFGARDAKIYSKIDLLAISSARPQDATATTLVMKTRLSRPKVRELLDNPAAPIAWSVRSGGLVGQRARRGEGQRAAAIDSRVLLSPWRPWYVLAAPQDLSSLLSSAKGELDTAEANAKLPKWLASIRAIEGESGKDAAGPALVVTLGRPRPGPGAETSGRLALPELRLGVASIPMPLRAAIAMELVEQGWLVRGTMRFATEPDATEFVQSAREVRRRILDSFVLSAIVARQHARNAVEGLTLVQSGSGVSYATSLSISDARAVLAAAAELLAAHFGQR